MPKQGWCYLHTITTRKGLIPPAFTQIIQIINDSTFSFFCFLALGYLRPMLALYPCYHGSRRIDLILVFPCNLPKVTSLVSYQGRVYLRQVTDTTVYRLKRKTAYRFSLLLRQPQACHTNALLHTCTFNLCFQGSPIHLTHFGKPYRVRNDSVTKVSLRLRSYIWSKS
jgi:hypothetical protein